MAKVIRLTESDLARIVRRVINENKNNTRYYSNRNLRRLGRTPVVMVESIDVYRPILMTEGILENFKEKLSSLFDKSKEFLREKAEDIKESIEDSFDKPLDEITLLLKDIIEKINFYLKTIKGHLLINMTMRILGMNIWVNQLKISLELGKEY